MQPNNQTTPDNHGVPAVQPASSTKKKFYNTTWFIILLCISSLLAFVVLGFLLRMNSGGTGAAAADTFYTMIETVAEKSKIRYGYYLSIPKVDKQAGVEVKSLAEYDVATGEYSAAYISDSITSAAARCVKGKEYKTAGDKTLPDDLSEAAEILKKPFKPSDGKFEAGTCKFLNARYQGDFTDGMLAVGLKPDQAKNMVNSLRDSKPAKLTDDGKTTYKGKDARKIRFEVGQSLTGLSYQSDAFFFSFRDGTSSKVGANIPLDDIPKHFDSTFQIPPVGLKGFYLIDEKTHLPLYRYLETVNDDKREGFAPQTVMSEYAFPDTLTMDDKTPLPEITKQ